MNGARGNCKYWLTGDELEGLRLTFVVGHLDRFLSMIGLGMRILGWPTIVGCGCSCKKLKSSKVRKWWRSLERWRLRTVTWKELLEPPGTIANWILVLTGSNHGPLPNLGDFMVAQSLGGMTQWLHLGGFSPTMIILNILTGCGLS